MSGLEQRPAVDDGTVSREHGRGENHAQSHLSNRHCIRGADDPSARRQRTSQRREGDHGDDDEPGHVGETSGDGDAARSADDARADGQGTDGDEADGGGSKRGRHGSCDRDRCAEEGEDRGDRRSRSAGEREVEGQPHAVPIRGWKRQRRRRESEHRGRDEQATERDAPVRLARDAPENASA